MKRLRTGQVAREAGVNVETLRYYERRGLLEGPARTASNYRLYPENAVRRVRFIKLAQELGFTLDEIKELLLLRASPKAGCADVRARATAKVADIDGKLRLLRSMRRALSKLIDECSGTGPISVCPILESFDDRSRRSK